MSGTEQPTLDELRALLASPKPHENLEAMEVVVPMRGAAAPLVPDLVRFLTSEAYVPCTSREYEFSGHAILAEEAMRIIEWIGAAPPVEDLRRLLCDRRVIMMPEASYDQGAYIGDYSSTTFSPAGLAARLVPLLADQSFVLLPELVSAALEHAGEVGRPARRALQLLAPVAVKAVPEGRAAYAAEIDRIACLPEVLAPDTHRGFELRDLARACNKVLGQGGPPSP